MNDKNKQNNVTNDAFDPLMPGVFTIFAGNSDTIILVQKQFWSIEEIKEYQKTGYESPEKHFLLLFDRLWKAYQYCFDQNLFKQEAGARVLRIESQETWDAVRNQAKKYGVSRAVRNMVSKHPNEEVDFLSYKFTDPNFIDIKKLNEDFVESEFESHGYHYDKFMDSIKNQSG